MTDIFNDGNHPPGARLRSDTPYNYDPETEKVPCDHCGEFIKVAIADEWNDYNFCPGGTCLNLFLNE